MQEENLGIRTGCCSEVKKCQCRISWTRREDAKTAADHDLFLEEGALSVVLCSRWMRMSDGNLWRVVVKMHKLSLTKIRMRRDVSIITDLLFPLASARRSRETIR